MLMLIQWIKHRGDGAPFEVIDELPPCHRRSVSEVEAHARVLYPITKLRLGGDRINGFRITLHPGGSEHVYWVEGGPYWREELR